MKRKHLPAATTPGTAPAQKLKAESGKLKTSDPREDAFLDGPAEIAGLQLRSLDITTLMLMRRANLSMLFGGGAQGDDDEFFQVCAFAWMLSEPAPRVLAAFRKKTWREDVETFGTTLSATAIPGLLSELSRIAQELAASLVEVLPQDDDPASRAETPGE